MNKIYPSAAAALAGIVREGDVVLTMGAGHIGAVSNELPRTLPAAVAMRGQRA